MLNGKKNDKVELFGESTRRTHSINLKIAATLNFKRTWQQTAAKPTWIKTEAALKYERIQFEEWVVPFIA